jgi:ribonuclease BN (tRNA processing enzyme)
VEVSGFDVSRRALLAALAATPAFGVATAKAALADEFAAEEARTREALRQGDGTKLVLLGTGGGPVPGQARNMTSHVMFHKGAAYVLDCGLGVSRQFARTGIPFSAVRAVFITHHHPDHTLEYGPFLILGWMGGMRQPAHTYGPPPLSQMTNDYFRSQKVTIDFWAQDFKIPLPKPTDAHDLATAGPVMLDDNVKVTSALVRHPPVTPAYGYRFDFPDRSIAFSGDTVAVEAVARLAKGADVLVHEAIDMEATEATIRQQLARGRPGKLEDYMAHMRADHTPTEDVGRIAQEAGVKTLVLSHLVPGNNSVGDAAWREAAGKYFKGRIIVGRDLMVV